MDDITLNYSLPLLTGRHILPAMHWHKFAWGDSFETQGSGVLGTLPRDDRL